MNRIIVGSTVISHGGTFGKVFWVGKTKRGDTRYGVQWDDGRRSFVWTSEVIGPLDTDQVERIKQLPHRLTGFLFAIRDNLS